MVLEVLPGDPALVMLGVDAPDTAVEALRNKLGLNRPAVERYFDWISHFLQGELGVSYTYSVPVTELLQERLLITIPLALLAMGLSVLIAFSLGIYAASHHNQKGDVLIMGISHLGISIPNFWLALLLLSLIHI